jgi:hypothetical protein
MFFKVGQYVISPEVAIPMKIIAINGDQIGCEWVDAKRQLRRETYSADRLKPFKRSRPTTIRF